MAINKNKVIASAQRYAQKGQLDRAIKEYRSIVDEDPEDVRIWLKIGDLYTKKGTLRDAVATYTRVATYYSDKGFFLKAVAVYKQILNIDPTYIEAHLKLAELYVQLGLSPDAIGQYQIVVGAYERDGRHKDSLDLLRRIVELAPDDLAARIRLAEAHVRQASNDSAAEEYRFVLNLLYQSGRFDEYVQVAERLLYLAPGDLDVIRTLAEVHLRRGDAKRALARLQTLFKSDPTNLDTLSLLARAFTELAQNVKAVSVYRELARLHSEMGDEGGRLEAYRKILSLDPYDNEAIQIVGTSHRPGAAAEPTRSGEWAASPAVTSTQGMQRLGAVASPVEEVLTPIQQIAQYLEDSELYLKYGLGEHALGRLNDVFQIQADHVGALVKLKEVSLALGRPGDALSALVRLARAMGDSERDVAMGYLGEALQIQPDHSEATRLMQRLSSGMAANLTRPPDGMRAASGRPEPMSASVEDVDVDFDLDAIDLDDEPQQQYTPVRRASASGAASAEDDFSDLLGGGEAPSDSEFDRMLAGDGDDFADLLGDEPAPVRGASTGGRPGTIDEEPLDDPMADESPAPRRAILPPRGGADDFGDLLSGAPGDEGLGDLLAGSRAADVDEATDLGDDGDDFADLLSAPAPRRPYGQSGGGVPVDTQVARDDDFGDLLGASDAAEDDYGPPPSQRPRDDDFGDLLGGQDPPEDDFADLLSGHDANVNVAQPVEDVASSVEMMPDDDEFADLLGRPAAGGSVDGPDDELSDLLSDLAATAAADPEPARPRFERREEDFDDLLGPPAREERGFADPRPSETDASAMGPLPSDGPLPIEGFDDLGRGSASPQADDLPDWSAPPRAQGSEIVSAFDDDPWGAPPTAASQRAVEAPRSSEASEVDPADELTSLLDDLAAETAEPPRAYQPRAYEPPRAPEPPRAYEPPRPPERRAPDLEEIDDGGDSTMLLDMSEPFSAPPPAAASSFDASESIELEADVASLPGVDLGLGEPGGDEIELLDDDNLEVVDDASPDDEDADGFDVFGDRHSGGFDVFDAPATDATSDVDAPGVHATPRSDRAPADDAESDLDAPHGDSRAPAPRLDDSSAPAAAASQEESLESMELSPDEEPLESMELAVEPDALDEVAFDFDEPGPTGLLSPRDAPAHADLTSEVAELDFLLDSNLFDDAQELLEELRAEHTGHPDLQTRRDRLARLTATPLPGETAAAATPSVDEDFDPSSVQGQTLTDLADEDVHAHFDLGLAFKEMGRYEKAIEQLEKAARAASTRPEALRVMALCDLALGNASRAVGRLREALDLPNVGRDARMGMHYDLASAFEALGDVPSATHHLRKVEDPEFLDVKARLRRLGA